MEYFIQIINKITQKKIPAWLLNIARPFIIIINRARNKYYWSTKKGDGRNDCYCFIIIYYSKYYFISKYYLLYTRYSYPTTPTTITLCELLIMQLKHARTAVTNQQFIRTAGFVVRCFFGSLWGWGGHLTLAVGGGNVRGKGRSSSSSVLGETELICWVVPRAKR